MIVLLKIAVVICCLLIPIRKKVDIGLTLALNSILAAILFGMNISSFGKSVVASVTAGETLNLAGIVILVLYLGDFLQAGGHFRLMVEALRKLLPDTRLVLAIPSAFIGLLPMTGGAMMGAPIVEEASKKWDLTPAWKTFFNYWFRHIWEYCWPLYVNLILAAAICRVPVMKICLTQFPFTLVAVAAGMAVLFHKVRFIPKDGEPSGTVKDFALVFFSIWPILLTIIFTFFFKWPMLISLGISSLLTLVFSGLPVRERGKVILRSLSPKIVLLTFAIMIFKGILENSGALESVIRVVSPRGLSAYLMLFALPFTIGLLTGVNQAFVAIAFPVLVPIIGGGQPDMILLAFAYVSGFVGILLSPAHLCLALTADYFKAGLRDVYRILIIPTAVVFLAALGMLVVSRLL